MTTNRGDAWDIQESGWLQRFRSTALVPKNSLYNGATMLIPFEAQRDLGPSIIPNLTQAVPLNLKTLTYPFIRTTDGWSWLEFRR